MVQLVILESQLIRVFRDNSGLLVPIIQSLQTLITFILKPQWDALTYGFRCINLSWLSPIAAGYTSSQAEIPNTKLISNEKQLIHR
uniref:Uncharacterized protein n=1 Tax=Arundo donax TaxID=35708 RepID=A0A0A9F9P7_ARUDO